MPDEEKKTVPIDTSGSDVTVDIEEAKEEAVIEQPEENTEKETGIDKSFENERETKLDEKKSDGELEDYSKGVQARIGKLTRKLREAERREHAALDYAKGVEESRQKLESKFKKTDSDYVKKFETSIQTGLEAAQKELGAAIDAGDSKAQVEANKRIATLAFENAKLEQIKQGQEEIVEEDKPTKPSQVQNAPDITKQPDNPDPRAEAWASKNTWFGNDSAMTHTALDLHKVLVEEEGYDPKSDEYYEEVEKRIKLEFPHKFDKIDGTSTERVKPTQNVASAKRSASTGRKRTVRLTPSQVAIAKKLGVPLSEYAKYVKD